MQDIKTLGEVLRQARKALFLRQIDVANELQVERQRVSEFERNRKRPNATERRILTRLLGLSEALILRLQLEPAKATKGTLRMVRGRPPQFEPRGDRPPSVRIAAMRRADRVLFDTLLGTLKRRVDWKQARTFLLKAPVDSQDEVLVEVRFLLSGLATNHLAPQRCGFRARPVINPETNEVIGDLPVPALSGVVLGHHCVVFVQLTLLVGFAHVRPDFLVGVRVGSEVRWGCIEVDGDGHVFARDEQRTALLGLPVLRVPAARALKPGFAAEVWRELFELLRIEVDAA